VRYDRHREQLPELILQATKVERVHADKPSVPRGLAKYLTMLHEELSSHMMKEEQILFPMIKQGMGSQAMGPISVMESEHDDAGELLEVIKHITHNVTPPPEACTTWKAMYNGINEMIDDLMEHISLENNVLRCIRRSKKGARSDYAYQAFNVFKRIFAGFLPINSQPRPSAMNHSGVTISAGVSSSVSSTSTKTKNAIHPAHQLAQRHLVDRFHAGADAVCGTPGTSTG
jgi:hemerythrin-like domain-containing protein